RHLVLLGIRVTRAGTSGAMRTSGHEATHCWRATHPIDVSTHRSPASFHMKATSAGRRLRLTSSQRRPALVSLTRTEIDLAIPAIDLALTIVMRHRASRAACVGDTPSSLDHSLHAALCCID